DDLLVMAGALDGARHLGGQALEDGDVVLVEGVDAGGVDLQQADDPPEAYKGDGEVAAHARVGPQAPQRLVDAWVVVEVGAVHRPTGRRRRAAEAATHR